MSSVSDRLTDALKAFGLPIVALSTGTAELLRLKGVGANLIAVAPPLSLYTEASEVA